MTKKDYEQIANALKEAGKNVCTTCSNCAAYTFDEIVDNIAEVLKADNARFDQSKFKAAVYNGLGYLI